MISYSAHFDKVAPALLAVQREVVPIQKDSVNPHLKSKFASLGAVTDTVRPILTKHALALVQSAERVADGLVVHTTLLHESGQWVANTVAIPMGEKANPQVAGSALTYGRRYGLSALLALTTDDDDDGQRGSSQRKQALKESRASAAVNDAKAITAGDVPFPPLKGMEAHKDVPLKDVPTDVLNVAYLRLKDHSAKSAQKFALAMADVLEDRRVPA